VRYRMLVAGTALLLVAALFAPYLFAKDLPTLIINPIMPFELRADFLVVVSGEVGELSGLKFILDTGSSYTVINQKVADRLRLARRPGKVTNFDRDVAVEWADIPELRIGPIHAQGFHVLVAKLEEYSQFAGDVDGIIGLDLLSRGKKLAIDYEKRLLSFELSDDGMAGRLPSRSFVVPIGIQGTRMRLLVDTGFHDILLYRSRVHEDLPNVRTEGESHSAVIGRMQATQVNLPGVRIAGPDAVEKVFLIDSPERGVPSGVDGYLGPAALHAKRIEFDFAAGKFRWQ
jgi:predicted aspartyl protease